MNTTCPIEISMDDGGSNFIRTECKMDANFDGTCCKN